jgi:alkylhydroperoxidase family enzyme
MGHCEMLLAVAGLDDKEITKRAGQLASADWPGVPPDERAAFAFARKMSINPWALGEADFRKLESHIGTERALDVAWWSARCQYMTRVADSFQLPLERENAFQGVIPPGRGTEKVGKKDKQD